VRYQKTILYVALFVCAFLAVGGLASAVSVPVDLNLTSPGGGFNQLYLKLTALGFISDSDTANVTGYIPANLEVNFDPVTFNPTVSGITFIENNPGTVSVGNLDFDFGLAGSATGRNLKASLATLTTSASPPGPVIGTSMPIEYHELVLNQGNISTSGSYDTSFDLGASPVRSGATTGSAGALSVTKTGSVGNAVTCAVELNVPVSFSQTVLTNPSVKVDSNVTLHATGSFTQTVVPEPGTIVMLLGLAVSAAGYWFRRRRA
jgi:hypothetical protein